MTAPKCDVCGAFIKTFQRCDQTTLFVARGDGTLIEEEVIDIDNEDWWTECSANPQEHECGWAVGYNDSYQLCLKRREEL